MQPFPPLPSLPPLPPSLSFPLLPSPPSSASPAVQFNFVTVVEDDEVNETEAALFWALDNEQPQGWEEEREINYSEIADRSTQSELCVCVCLFVFLSSVCVCVCLRERGVVFPHPLQQAPPACSTTDSQHRSTSRCAECCAQDTHAHMQPLQIEPDPYVPGACWW